MTDRERRARELREALRHALRSGALASTPPWRLPPVLHNAALAYAHAWREGNQQPVLLTREPHA
jgi:hypothetical protein